MEAVLINIPSKWIEKILSGEKTIEIRRDCPRIKTPFKCYLYCKKGVEVWDYGTNAILQTDPHKGKVIGEFVCDKIYVYSSITIDSAKFEVNGGEVREEQRYNAGACLDSEEMYYYSNGADLYGWHIADLKVYKQPKDISEFMKVCYKASDCEDCNNATINCGSCNGEFDYAPKDWCYIGVAK